jgi:hydroxylaminobenzene mutase
MAEDDHPPGRLTETSGASESGRRLAFHGMVLFLVGLLMGIVVPAVANPRLGLSAHTGTLLNGAFLIAVGAVWAWVRLAPPIAATAYWLTVAGSYAGSLVLFLAGVWGTSRSTPLHGAGHAGTPWQENVVAAGLTLGGIALLLGSALVVWGLRGRGRWQ